MLSLPWAQNNSVLFFVILLFVIYVLRGILISQLRKRAFLFYAILYPGVILHEISHLIGCIIGGAKVHKLKLVSQTGGEVVHEKSKIPIVGNFIISIFPLVLGGLAIFLLVSYPLKNNFLSFSTLLEFVIKLLSFYLLAAILLTMFPSQEDVKNAVFLYLLAILAGILVILRTHWSIPFFLINTEIFCVFFLIMVNLILLIISIGFKKWR